MDHLKDNRDIFKKNDKCFKLYEFYHVGTLKKEDKRNDSYEGLGLSVSICPDAWRKIAKLPGETFYCEKTLPLLNFYGQEFEIKKECLDKKLLVNECRYKSFLTNEDGDECFMVHKTKDAALLEVDGDESLVKKFTTVVASEKLLKNLGKDFQYSDIHALQLASTVLVDKYKGFSNYYDGVYFDEKLDVHNYSAPRGVIAPSKIDNYIKCFTKI